MADDPDLTPFNSDARMRRDAERLRARSWNVNWKVIGFVLGAGTLGAAWLFVRVGGAIDDGDVYLPEPAVGYGDPWMQPTEPVLVPPPLPAPEPEPVLYDAIEWTVHIGEWSSDVDRERVTLPGDIPVRLGAAGQHVWSSEALSFRHPASFRVSESPRSEVIVRGPNGVEVTIAPVAPEADLAAAAERVLGAATSPLERIEPEHRRLDVEVVEEVAHWDGARVAAEAAAFRLSDEQAVVVHVTYGTGATPADVSAIFESLRAGPREPGAVVELWYLGVRHAITTVPTPLESLPGAPEAWAERREPTVRRLGPVVLEHAPGRIVSRAYGGLLLEDAGVRLYVMAEDGADPAALLPPALPSESQPRVARRTVAGETREGTRSSAGDEIREAYATSIDGVAVALILEHSPRARAAASSLFDEVAESLRVARE